MSEQDNQKIIRWLFVVCGLIMVMVVFGGYVRLTRSGLSIVEWNPISGVIPPIGQEAWEAEFAKYQQTPEGMFINNNMTLEGYKEIFYIEYLHRLIARFAGLIVVIPLFYYIYKGIIPWRKSFVYLSIGALFGFQGFLGWYMVSSGLVENPAVDHIRLTIHLLMALFLLALTMWTALRHMQNFPPVINKGRGSLPYVLSALVLVILVIQIAWGGFVAGLKAGWMSNTFPLMAGRWIPPNLFTQFDSWWQNLISAPVTVHFVHRWFAFVVLAAAIGLYFITKRHAYSANVHKAVIGFLGLVAVQIALGVSTIWFSVPLILALSHQAVGLLLFVIAVYIRYEIVHTPIPERIVAQPTAVAQTGD
ncbi:COX15/CtaA family protein [Candidatus Leptofilum sp.]|uniref:COX15/CtaA family protein n=1 Tax=Candidatus Leptofilum sp. TaxID=3241576 RepID=UPI003B5CD928